MLADSTKGTTRLEIGVCVKDTLCIISAKIGLSCIAPCEAGQVAVDIWEAKDRMCSWIREWSRRRAA